MALGQAFTYPTSSELREIEQAKLPMLTRDSPIFQLFPIVNSNSHLLEWTQRDNYVGMQQIRGMNGLPPRVTVGLGKSYLMRPGVYGEHMAIDEMEMTVRASSISSREPVAIDDLVTERQDRLLERRLNRIEYLDWQLAIYGRFMVFDNQSALLHAGTYETQTYTASPAWLNPTTAKPMYDFRQMALLGRGQSVDFGRGGDAYMNQITANYLLANTNAADLGGYRLAPSVPVNSLPGINTILSGQGLPNINVYDEGYFTDAGVWTPWIPDNKVVLIGRRTNGAAIGEYRMTRNVSNPGSAPGPYTGVLDYRGKRYPPEIEVHDGHNGGPVIFYPGAIVAADV